MMQLTLRFCIWLAFAPLFLWPPVGTTAAGPKEPCPTISLESYWKASEGEQISAVERYRERVRARFDKLQSILERLFYDPLAPRQQFLIEARLKTVASIREKLVRKELANKPYTCMSQMTGIIGLRVIVPDWTTLDLINGLIQQERLWRVLRTKDQISYRENAIYRAMHYDVQFVGRLAEIQIHTRRGTIVAAASHKLVYKGPYKNNSRVRQYLQRLSYAVLFRDYGLERVLPVVPPELPKAAYRCLARFVLQIEAVRTVAGFVFDDTCEVP